MRSFSTLALFLRTLFFNQSSFTLDSSAGKTFVYYLHVDPESSTCVEAPYAVHQISNIYQISSLLSSSDTLVVKEHPCMLGKRSSRFYNQVLKCYRTKLHLFSFQSEQPPADYVPISVTGTIALEYSLINKPSVLLGQPFFKNFFPSIYSLEDINRINSSYLILNLIIGIFLTS